MALCRNVRCGVWNISLCRSRLSLQSFSFHFPIFASKNFLFRKTFFFSVGKLLYFFLGKRYFSTSENVIFVSRKIHSLFPKKRVLLVSPEALFFIFWKTTEALHTTDNSHSVSTHSYLSFRLCLVSEKKDEELTVFFHQIGGDFIISKLLVNLLK